MQYNDAVLQKIIIGGSIYNVQYPAETVQNIKYYRYMYSQRNLKG